MEVQQAYFPQTRQVTGSQALLRHAASDVRSLIAAAEASTSYYSRTKGIMQALLCARRLPKLERPTPVC